MQRTLLRGGHVADGAGNPVARLDVLVEDGLIVAVEASIDAPAASVVNVTGQVVCPGFINVLSQAHFSLQRDPRAVSEISQGVTTVVLGEGFSLGPVNKQAQMLLAPQMPEDVGWAYPRLTDGLVKLVAAGSMVNVASMVGHDNLRLGSVGGASRDSTSAEREQMCDSLRVQLEEGALGLGAAIMYAPSQFASRGEFECLAEVVAEHDAVFAVHLRDESDGLTTSLREVIDIAERTGVRVHVYHLKVAGERNWGRAAEAIDLIEAARSRGILMDGDIYPYVAGGTSLLAAVPHEHHAHGTGPLLDALRSPATRGPILKAIEAGGAHQSLYRDCGGAEGILLTVPAGPLDGLELPITLADAAANRGIDPLELLADVVTANPAAWAVYFLADVADLETFIQRPWVSVCSDASTAAAETGTEAGARALHEDLHPRAFGSFARVLGHYVRDRGLLSLEQAVHRMTGLPASSFGLSGRGVVAPGAVADLTVFDPATIEDRASYTRPQTLSEGVRLVLVGGEVAWDHGRCGLPGLGKVVRRSR